MTTMAVSSRTFWLALLLVALTATARARDLHVDPTVGDDTSDGTSSPVRTLARAIRLAEPGDTIHLQPVVYRDWAAFFDKAGEPGRPITLDGHGATLDGCDPLDPTGWQEVSPGLFRHHDLLPLTDAIVDRWFFLWDGRLNRMNRCSKGPSEPLKTPEALLPGEWTFVKDAARPAARGYIHGTFFLRLPPGQSLAAARIQVPMRPAGVLMHGKSAHLIVRNLTSTHPYNDGFNLSDCRDVRFENIRAIDCGDDGISAHGECRYVVDGLTSRGNATGICDTGNSETSYRRVQIRDCVGFDLFFLDTGRYTVHDAVIHSTAAKALYLQGRESPAAPCCLTLENVLIERAETANEVRVSPNCRLTARHVALLGLDVQATGGDIELEQSLIGGFVPDTPPRKPRIHLWKDATWRARDNIYDLEALRVAQTFFTPETFAEFQQLTLSDASSRWTTATLETARSRGVGPDWPRLRSLVEPEESP